MNHSFSEPKNPFEEKIEVVSNAINYWRKQGNLRMEDRMYNVWHRLVEKGSHWENAMAQVRCEVLDAVEAYEKRVGLR